MKKVLLLNAGHTEEPLIKELKQLGVYLVTSGNRPDMPGHKEADQYIQADYSDKDAILEMVKEEKIDGIISCAHDYGMVTAAYVAEQMGWKGHDSLKNTMLLHEKDQFKELCVKLGIRSPLSTCFDLEKDAVLYDVGAGTGSVAVEAACQDGSIRVYAIEKNPEGIELIRKNVQKLRTDNVQIVEGTAPEALRKLEPPTHVFIGGSSGNLREILLAVKKKNPDVQIVLTAISLDTMAEVMEAVDEGLLREPEIVQITAAKARKLGRHHMMTGQNPIYIISEGEA